MRASIVLSLTLLAGCASQSPITTGNYSSPAEGCTRTVATVAAGAPVRNCASDLEKLSGTDLYEEFVRNPSSLRYPVVGFARWAEGDYQLNYEPDREIAEQKAEKAKPATSPDASDVSIEQLASLVTGGKGREAELAIKKYLRKNGSDKRAVFLLAVNYFRAKRKELATFMFKELEKDPGFAWKSLVLNNLGMLSLQDQNQSAAIGYFERATKSEPLTPAPFVNLGALYLKSRSYSDAEQLFSRAVQLDGDFEDAVAGWGSALEGLGKFEEAHKVYSQFIESHGNATTVLFNDAMILGTRLNTKEPAIRLMQKYLEIGGREKTRAHEMIQNWR